VVAEAAARSNVMHTFTGAFNDSPYYDEREGARAVASHVGAQVHEIEITDQDYADHIGDVIYHLDEPSVGTGALPQYMVSKLASQHITVMLTGHGGDEAYAGYQVNKAVLIRETLTHRAWKLPRVLTDVQRDEWTRVLYYLLYPLFRSEVRHGLFIATPRSKRQMLLSGDFLDKCGDYEPLDEIQNVLGGSSLSPEQRLVILYLRTYLPTLLMQEDRMGMAHSIESRMPFCDNEIIDLGVSLPLLVKLGGGQLKAVIKEAMRPTLPPVLFGMPKRGFPTPFARWYRRSPLREMMEELLLGQRARQRGLFNPAAVQAIFKKNVASRTDNLYDYANANILHSLSMVELWFRTFIDSDGRGS